MKRRGYLAALAAGLGVTAGCGELSGDRSPTGTAAPVPRTAAARGPPRPTEPSELPVPASELDRAAPRDGIPAITDPAFGPDWEGITVTAESLSRGEYTVDLSLRPAEPVVGVALGGRARAYPLKLLSWHEVVNDAFGERPLLVTYCPLCGSSVVAERTVGGEPTGFGVSGLLWNQNLVLYDERSDSLWSQLAAMAIRGPRTGAGLSLVPSTVARLETWRAEHPGTEVLLPPPESGSTDDRTFNYNQDRYGAYYASRRVGAPGIGRDASDSRIHPKTSVLGVVTDDVVRAYPYPVVRERRVINDTVGSLPVVVATGPERSVSTLSGTMVAYDRRVGGRTLSFERTAAGKLLAGGSRWTVTTGRALDGPHEGARLAPVGPPPQFWFAWEERHPGTELFGHPAEAGS